MTSRLSFSTGREENCRSRDAPSEKKRSAGDEHFVCHMICSRNHNVILTKVHSHTVMRDEEQFSDELDEPIGSMPTAKMHVFSGSVFGAGSGALVPSVLLNLERREQKQS